MKLKLSVNLKILFLIISVLMITVGYLINFSVRIQQQDKISQAYQIQLNETRLLGNSFNSHIDNTLNTLRQVAALDWSQSETQQQVQYILQNQKEINRVYLVEVPTDGKDMSLLFKSSNEYGDHEVRLVKDWTVNRIEQLTKKQFALYNLAADRGVPQVGVSIADIGYDEKSKKILVFTAVLNSEKIFDNLSYLVEVVDAEGELIYTSDYKNLLTKEYNKQLFKQASQSRLSAGTLEIEEKEQKTLGSYTKLPYETIFLTSQPLIKVVSNIYMTTQKLIIIGLIALSLAVILTIQLSRSISNPIEQLTSATKKIAEGKFDIKLTKKSNDEIGVLAKNFEIMSGKIQGLLVEQADKVRLENEMNITATIQKTLFPENSIISQAVDIFSHSAPASECGGDIWGYFTNKSKLYFVIADATGHGLPSALITVAAKSTMSLVRRMLEQNIAVSPAEVLSYANRTVYETSQGKIMMTCFIGVIDFETGELTYSNAGHNPPWVFSEDKIHSLTIPSTRLGEKMEQNEFKEKTLKLKKGDKIFLYTDGIVENTNTEGQPFDKKRVRNLVKDSLKKGAAKTLDHLVKEFNKFMLNKKALDDDTTVVIMDIKEIGQEMEDAA